MEKMKKRGLVLSLALLLAISFAYADDIPVVTLNEPANGASVDVGEVVFNFSAADDGVIANCSLFGNFTGWIINQTIGNVTKIYNETANASAVGNFNDGDWDTYNARDDYTYYMDYTKPQGAAAAVWTISGGVLLDHAPRNYTIPGSCFNYDNDKIILRAVTNQGLTGFSYWDCFDGSWINVKTYDGGKGFWEEAVWFTNSTIQNDTITNFGAVPLAEGYYNWSVRCYDEAGQEDYADSGFSLDVGNATIVVPPAPTPPSGGSGGSKTPDDGEEDDTGEEEILVIEPLPGEETLTEEQVAEVKANTALSFNDGISRESLEEGKLSLSFVNTGEKIIKDIEVEVEKPPLEEKPNLPHTTRVFGWDEIKLTGWATASHVQEPALMEWEVPDTQEIDELRPGEKIDLDLEIKTPLTKEKLVELQFDIKSFGKSIYTESVPVEIDTTEFLVIADVNKEAKVADVYMVVSNLKDEESLNYIELNFNKEGSTAGAEYYGPYRIQADSTMLFAYRYEYNEEFADDYELKYTLYTEEGISSQIEGKLDLI